MKLEKLYGKIRQLNFGKTPLWQFYLNYGGKHLALQRGADGKPLRTREQAFQLQGQISTEIQIGNFKIDDWGKKFSFEKILERWLANQTCSPDWLRQKKRLTRKFLVPYFKGKDIRNLTTDDVTEFWQNLKKKGYGDKYNKLIMSELKMFLATHRKIIKDFPTFPKITVQDSQIKWLNQKQQDQVFKFIPSQHRKIFDFLRFSGARLNEACGLQKIDVDFDKGTFIISSVIDERGGLKKSTKTKQNRPLPIIPELVKPLTWGKENETSFVFIRPDGKPYRKKVLERIWRIANGKANKESGTPLIGCYAGLKHSFGMQRLEQGFQLEQIKAVMGHTDIRTTEKYARYLPQHLSEVMSGKTKKFTKSLRGKKSITY